MIELLRRIRFFILERVFQLESYDLFFNERKIADIRVITWQCETFRMVGELIPTPEYAQYKKLFESYSKLHKESFQRCEQPHPAIEDDLHKFQAEIYETGKLRICSRKTGKWRNLSQVHIEEQKIIWRWGPNSQ